MRQDIFHSVTDGSNLLDEIELELRQDDLNEVLHLTVSKFAPLAGDKLSYEGIGNDGPYKLSMPPYCISDIRKAQASLVSYMRRAKSAYFNHFVNRSNALLMNTFKMAAFCDVSIYNDKLERGDPGSKESSPQRDHWLIRRWTFGPRPGLLSALGHYVEATPWVSILSRVAQIHGEALFQSPQLWISNSIKL